MQNPSGRYSRSEVVYSRSDHQYSRIPAGYSRIGGIYSRSSHLLSLERGLLSFGIRSLHLEICMITSGRYSRSEVVYSRSEQIYSRSNMLLLSCDLTDNHDQSPRRYVHLLWDKRLGIHTIIIRNGIRKNSLVYYLSIDNGHDCFSISYVFFIY